MKIFNDFPMHLRFFFSMLLALVAGLSLTGFAGESVAGEPVAEVTGKPALERVFLEVDRFEALRKEGAAVFDVRAEAQFKASRIPGAAHTPWEAFVEESASGLVSGDDAKLTRLLRQAGVKEDKPVLIYGNWSASDAWGEEGRLLWMLHYLGKKDVYILQGGFNGWRNAGHSPADKLTRPAPGDFRLKRQSSIRARGNELLSKLKADAKDLVFLDTREAVEYAGTVKYGEKRAGHIPGARHLWWHDLFGADGNLHSEAELRRLFKARGITPDKTIVPYCTGGIRSGFVYAVLIALGYENVQNYDGSMWEWSARKDAPLTR